MEGKECIWSGIDYALEPAMRRVLRAVFSSVQAAQEMYGFFEEVSKALLKEIKIHLYRKEYKYIRNVCKIYRMICISTGTGQCEASRCC